MISSLLLMTKKVVENSVTKALDAPELFDSNKEMRIEVVVIEEINMMRSAANVLDMLDEMPNSLQVVQIEWIETEVPKGIAVDNQDDVKEDQDSLHSLPYSFSQIVMRAKPDRNENHGVMGKDTHKMFDEMLNNSTIIQEEARGRLIDSDFNKLDNNSHEVFDESTDPLPVCSPSCVEIIAKDWNEPVELGKQMENESLQVFNKITNSISTGLSSFSSFRIATEEFSTLFLVVNLENEYQDLLPYSISQIFMGAKPSQFESPGVREKVAHHLFDKIMKPFSVEPKEELFAHNSSLPLLDGVPHVIVPKSATTTVSSTMLINFEMHQTNVRDIRLDLKLNDCSWFDEISKFIFDPGSSSWFHNGLFNYIMVVINDTQPFAFDPGGEDCGMLEHWMRSAGALEGNMWDDRVMNKWVVIATKTSCYEHGYTIVFIEQLPFDLPRRMGTASKESYPNLDSLHITIVSILTLGDNNDFYFATPQYDQFNKLKKWKRLNSDIDQQGNQEHLSSAIFSKRVHDLTRIKNGYVDLYETTRDDNLSCDIGFTLQNDLSCKMKGSWTTTHPFISLMCEKTYFDDCKKIKAASMLMQMIAAEWLKSNKREENISVMKFNGDLFIRDGNNFVWDTVCGHIIVGNDVFEGGNDVHRYESMR